MNSLPTIDGLHSAESLTPALFDSIFHCAERIEADPKSFVDSLRGKIIGTIFHEPSTRTRLSFESAAQKMGGGIISIADPQTTSEAKGESLADMIRVVSSYADVLVLRHSRDGASRYASRFSSVPIINGGDGRLGHPTQTLVDLYTLHKSWEGDFADKTVGLMGDLKNGRTVRSLAWSLASLGARFVVLPVPGLDWEASFEQRIMEYFDMRMRFVSHPLFEKWTGNQEARVIEPKGLVQKELFGNTVPKMDSLDALYLTRIQAERGANASGPFTGVNSEILKDPLLENCSLLHPLPRLAELPIEVDNDPRALYFSQAANGPIIRQAVYLSVLANRDYDLRPLPTLSAGSDLHHLGSCPNPNCVSHLEERAFPWRFFGNSRRFFLCSWCDSKLSVDYVGCSSSRKVHPIHSPLAQRILPENIQPFLARADAEKAGYAWGH